MIRYKIIQQGNNQCELLGPFALLIQSFLGLLALSSLVIKRYNEYPNKRPWKIWLFDVSKQVIGAFGIHIVNIFISILGGSSDKFLCSKNDNNEDNDDNPCDYYFLNIFFDTTIGIPILWFSLYMIFNLANNLGIKGINSGQYGNPPIFINYLKQLILYFFGLIIMKIILYSLLLKFPFIIKMASWLLNWSDPFPRFQVVFVLLIFPLIMNSFQYYVVDNIIQSPEYNLTNKKLHELEIERLNIINYGSINSPPILTSNNSTTNLSSNLNLNLNSNDDQLEIEGMLGQHQLVKNNLKNNNDNLTNL